MKRLRVGNSSFWKAIFLAGIVMTVGCEQGPMPANLSPVQPDDPAVLAKGGNGKTEETGNDKKDKKDKRDKRLKKKVKNCAGTKAKKIGPEGGALEFCDYRMDVPAGALTEVREMSITIIQSEGDYFDAKFKAVDFGADGWFEQPVKITIWYENAELQGLDPADLLIVWYNEDTGEWEEVETEVHRNARKVVARVWHFTQYSLAAR